MRGLVALALFGLLAVEVGCGISATHEIASTKEFNADDRTSRVKIIMDFFNTVISPTVALLGAATGFYYGTKSDSK